MPRLSASNAMNSCVLLAEANGFAWQRMMGNLE
jgi:hypothetical protein